jgi:hypothetical protein
MNTAQTDLDDSQIFSGASCLEHQPWGDTVRQKAQTNLRCDYPPRTSQPSLQPTVEDAPDEHWLQPTRCINSANSCLLFLFQHRNPPNPRRRSLDQTGFDCVVSRPTKKQMRGTSVVDLVAIF